MYNNLKKEIEKDFNKEKNYNAIIFRKEEVINMKKIILKYILAPVCIIIIALIGIRKSNLFNLKNFLIYTRYIFTRIFATNYEINSFYH